MFERAAVSEVRGQSESLRRLCGACSHVEFVHADGEPRWCLFSECSCPSYTIALPSIEPEPADSSVA